MQCQRCIDVVVARGDAVVAVASLNFDPIVSQAAEMFQAGKTISKAEIQYVLSSEPLSTIMRFSMLHYQNHYPQSWDTVCN